MTKLIPGKLYIIRNTTTTFYRKCRDRAVCYDGTYKHNDVVLYMENIIIHSQGIGNKNTYLKLLFGSKIVYTHDSWQIYFMEVE